jgi:hypothetical protein
MKKWRKLDLKKRVAAGGWRLAESLERQCYVSFSFLGLDLILVVHTFLLNIYL